VTSAGHGAVRKLRRELHDLRAAWYLWRRGRSADDMTALQARHNLVDLIRAYVFPSFRLTDFGKLWWEDDEFFGDHGRFADSDFNAERTFFLRQLLKLVDHLEGNTAEAGVYRGSASWFMCDARAGRDSTHFAFDSFEGLSQPRSEDSSDWKAGMLRADEVLVRNALAPYQAEIVRGWIPKVFGSTDIAPLVFAHVDVDLYEPTLASVAHFYPALVSGGILICDDYGLTTCPGARQAFDEYMESRPEPIITCPTGQGFVLKR
jgi:O-methyltransferase